MCVFVFVEGPQLHIDHRLATTGSVCLSSVPSCMATIDSQLGACVCLPRDPSPMSSFFDSQLRGVCVFVEGTHLHVHHRLATGVCVFLEGP